MTPPVVDAAVVLAGGAGRRLGGVDKPALRLAADRTLLQVALDAVAGAMVVVVGPPRELPAAVYQVQEDPPGSGPAAAVAAGLQELSGRLDPQSTVAVLAADLPAVTDATVRGLARALDDPDGAGGVGGAGGGAGAVLIDAAGRRQYLLGVFRAGPLLAAARSTDWSGRSARDLLGPLVDVEVPASGAEAADIDTPEHYRRWGPAPTEP